MPLTRTEEFVICEGDTSPVFQGTCQRINESTGAWEAVDLTGASAKLKVRKHGATTLTLDVAMEVLSPETAGKVRYQWLTADTAQGRAADYHAKVEVTYATGKIESFPNYGHIRLKITEDLDPTP